MGTLTMGPLQADLSPNDGAELIRAAYDRGVTFFDTAELYSTYEHIAMALRSIPRESIVIASRCYEYTYEGMQASIVRALESLGTDYIDIFGLHEQESRLTLKGHAQALRCACDARRKGLIRAVSVSTHAIEVVQAAGDIPGIDVVHPIFNMRGIGIIDGNLPEMAEAMSSVAAKGLGVYSMKPLGGGHIFRQAERAISWVLKHDYIHSMAIGIRSMAELELDVALVEGREVDPETLASIAGAKRLFIEDWCARCGACVEACGQGALRMGPDRVEVDHDSCVLCGYCVAHCPEFCIKVL